MGATSWEVKARYNKKAYDTISVSVKKGKKDELKKIAADRGMSLNAFINFCIEEQIKSK